MEDRKINNSKNSNNKKITDNETHVYPIEKERELLACIKLGDKEHAQQVVNEIFDNLFFSDDKNSLLIKSRLLELIILLSRSAMEGGADVEQIFGMNSICISELNSQKNINDIKTWLPNIVERFTDSVFKLKDVKHVDVIYKAVDYIRNNYMNKITLKEVSDLVYLSPAYFSTVFSKEMGCTFNEYLNQVKIEMSKKLLLDDSVSLVDIPNEVGYESQSYFSRVFKNVTGISPGKYKSSRGHV